ncbi:DUF6111 family protein [Bradyrhizobium septentrionale]|uniref:DUF6111 family protein n=1 Tax=Bradyrhizobium septentrionale TaxID=1404411 RepID=A0A973W6G8_9BRAD|nr:DUF6111 family protein [Bradyrhizobium septentrionale]UGY17147.1 DUF6111 family protein [Bradyrhizobium septentrionale]UGY25891.1 DUF6111 family protein [Bradyrhizobium septentrionale]
MIRTVLTEIGVFLIPFAVYAIYLIATRAGVTLPASWPLDMLAKLTLAALVLVIISFVLLAELTGAPPNSTYVPAHIEDGRLVPGAEK